ncbi:MAG: M56 family metallopeptidase [Phycisphaerae bacterium]|nr:M56 family metallopeptidase [Gemmatimonadaceae bacterium]
MIAAWMIFAMEIGALLFAAAWIAEGALRAAKRPVRGVWVGAVLGTNLLPFLIACSPLSASLTNRWALAVAPESMLSRFGPVLMGLWGVALTLGVLVCLSAAWRMSRTRPLWKTEHVDNTPVLVSHDIGPALVGVLHYSIVVPQWACSLEAGARRLLLAHEREHARKYDPLLLTVGVLAVVLAPWNVFNWLCLKRLHLAVELDCDQRVLRAHPDARTYGALLLDVAERVLPSVMPAAAFVEHGSSLETRINAMGDNKKSFQALRGACGLTLSMLIAAAACFTPRPYAIIIVNPAAPAAGAQTASTPGTLQFEPAMAQSTPGGVPVRESSEFPRSASAMDNADIRPVPPSARVRALDDAENERMRTIVAKNAPGALGSFARGDSALVLLLNDGGAALKQTRVSLTDAGEGVDAMHVFAKVFPEPDINAISSASRFTIDRGASNEPLPTPLTLFTAYQIAGVPTARLLSELTPSANELIAQVRARHPTALTDRNADSNVVMMLFDTRGHVLKSTTVVVDTSGVVPSADESYGWHRAFGTTFMDSGSLIDRGTLVQYDGNQRQQRPLVIAYGTMLMRAEFLDFEKLLEGKRRNWTFGGSTRRPGRGASVDHDAMTARLRVLVHTQVPDAYGDWSRRDSVLIFLFDANNNLVARNTGPVPDSYGMNPLADYISLRVLTIPPDDIVSAGWTNRVASESGRVLDQPLQVVWGRLSADATRKRELARLGKR